MSTRVVGVEDNESKWICAQAHESGLPMNPPMRGCGHIWADGTQPLICPECLNPCTQIDPLPDEDRSQP